MTRRCANEKYIKQNITFISDMKKNSINHDHDGRLNTLIMIINSKNSIHVHDHYDHLDHLDHDHLDDDLDDDLVDDLEGDLDDGRLNVAAHTD